MKFLVLALVVVVVLWLLRSKSRRDLPSAPPAPPACAPSASAEPGQEEMLACAHCGLHLPRSEALTGPDGVFCGEAHRLAHQQRDTR